MTGVTLEFVGREALEALAAGAAALADPTPLQRDLGELLLIIHQARFRAQVSPDGQPWQALSPRYLRRKPRNRDKVLTLSGTLRNTLRYQVVGDDLLFGTDRPYGAIHQFGGQIQMPARQSTVYFRQSKSGDVGREFVRRDRSNFAQDVKIGPYTISMPARPWLGVGEQDEPRLLDRVQAFLEGAFSARR
ncbi:phage virion morphogenesis protein [Pseudomonas paralcaligenes]|uniref:phage virion morphogenesis protein n=1 Tax=Pseudomonas paralcaligenes TaxID=2772558 RepID=UPI001C8235E5|nr:phage virion morphogenesis protein [Pseudomonas paralcaligenes]